MATQALLKSLCYDPHGQDTVQQTKAGLPHYDGNPNDFEQWYFVVMGKYDAYASKKDVEVQTQYRIELSVKVIEGLKDDALKCAMGLGRDVVVAPDGVLRIAEAIKTSWTGKLEIATIELYRGGGKKDGVLARVPGESMASYVSRSRRWCRSLTTLDKTFSIPEHLQLEMMMDCAGITDHQQQLARLAATKPLTLEKMSLALVQEYPLIHEKEPSRGRERPHPVRRPFPRRPSNRFQPVRSSVSRAYWSHADQESEDVCWEDAHDADDDENNVSDDAAYWCHSCGPDGEFGDVVDRTEQDIVCAFVAADCSLSDEDVCEDISECVHAECAAFFGREQALQHGVHVEKVVHSFRPKSELEIKKRREQVEHAKRNSTCRTCAARRGRGTPTGAETCRRLTKST